MKRNWKKYIAPAVAAVIAFIWQFYGVWNIAPLITVEQFFTDALYRQPVGSSQNIKIIGVDEETLAAYGKFEDWSREKTAELLELLSEDEAFAPAVIGLDILFVNARAEDSAEDERLAAACAKAGNVVVASNLVYRTAIDRQENALYYDKWHVDRVEMPYPALLAVTTSGFTNTILDSDGFIRRTKLSEECQGEMQRSFAWQTASRYLAEQEDTVSLTEETLVQFLYSGVPKEYEKISLCDVLDGKVDARIFKDSIVLVGAYAEGMQDAYHTAVAHSSRMYGVEVQANIIEALLKGKLAEDAPRLPLAVVIAVLLTAYVLFAADKKLSVTLAVGGSIMTIWLIICLIVKGTDTFLPFSVPELGMLLLMIYFVVARYLHERQGRKNVIKVFERYVEPQVVQELSKENSAVAHLGGTRREVAVLFVDIRGFTTISETLEPEQVVEVLNEYLDVTSKAIARHQGMLDKFIGDAAMAVFNAPADLEDYVFKAVCAADDMLKQAEALEEKLKERFGHSVQFGVGINSGPAIVGNIGSEERMDYTAVGDTVNTASRLEGMAGRGEILLGEAVYEAVKDRIEAEPVGELELKGKVKKIQTYRFVRIKEA